MRNIAIVAAAGLLGFLGSSSIVAGAGEEKKGSAAEAEVEKHRFVVIEPRAFATNTDVVRCHAGDLLYLQFTTPTRPPFLQKAKVTSPTRAMTVLAVAGADHAVYMPAERSEIGGLIGVKYFGVVVRANSSGEVPLSVEAEYDNGQKKSITVGVIIEEGPQAE